MVLYTNHNNLNLSILKNRLKQVCLFRDRKPWCFMSSGDRLVMEPSLCQAHLSEFLYKFEYTIIRLARCLSQEDKVWLRGNLRYTLLGPKGREHILVGVYAWSIFHHYVIIENEDLTLFYGKWSLFASSKRERCYDYKHLSGEMGMVGVYRCMREDLHQAFVHPASKNRWKIFNNL